MPRNVYTTKLIEPKRRGRPTQPPRGVYLRPVVGTRAYYQQEAQRLVARAHRQGIELHVSLEHVDPFTIRPSEAVDPAHAALISASKKRRPPIVIGAGKIIDGNHRLRAARLRGATVRACVVAPEGLAWLRAQGAPALVIAEVVGLLDRRCRQTGFGRPSTARTLW